MGYTGSMWVGPRGSAPSREERKRSARIEVHELDLAIVQKRAELQALEDRRRILEGILSE